MRTFWPATLVATTIATTAVAWGQTYTPFPSPPVIDASGGPGTPGQNKSGQGTDGKPGGGGGPIYRLLQSPVTGGGSTPVVSALSNGGRGGNGGAGTGTIIGADGGAGGTGGPGGLVNLDLLGGSSITSASSGGALRVAATGGAGGTGGGTANRGNAGRPGNGGAGGTLNVASSPGSTVASSEPAVAAVLLTANGGNGATLPGTSQNFTNARANDGGSGGRGGSISYSASGTPGYGVVIRSAGSGIVAIAAGGNGNTGGAASSGTAGAFGGHGGRGGDGGTINLVQAGAASQIYAIGAPAPATGSMFVVDGVTIRLSVVSAGMLGESLGGSGGAGGAAQAGFGPGVGGNGGGAGNGGPVTLRQDGGSVQTTGYAAAGLFASSVGGSGGNGKSAGAVFSRTGGNGGSAGNGASTDVRAQLGFVATTGDASPALVSQSLGGGGGFGGDVRLTAPIAAVVIGGGGGQGGNGDSSSIYNGSGDPKGVFIAGSVLTTAGADSPGMLAQSVGGGGGIGGDAAAFSLGATSVAIGGRGGAGGNGGAISIGNLGVIQTTGAHSAGIAAQSIGGGGGDGGFGSSLAVGAQYTASTAVGGSGGSGGTGSFILASNFNQITTAGDDSDGILAQSVGGGGGIGGDALSRVFQVYNDPRIPSILVNVAVGGSGGNGGTSGSVTTFNDGAVLTEGADAVGIVAQSIGGGGGDGGDASTLSQSFRQANIQSNVTIGGNGGNGGNAGPVSASSSGFVFTLGEEATGIVAQSIGGGGGNGAVANADTGSVVGQDNKLAISVNLGIGGRGGAGGSGGNVGVTVGGGVLTRGDAAGGVLAQSVGGGGGTGALGKVLGSGGTISVNLGIGGNGSAGGNGGTVTVNNTGAILTGGGDAPAVIAQSIGGGGGDGGEAATAGGTFPALPAAKFLASGFGIGLPVSDNGGSGVFSLAPSAFSALASLKELRSVLQSYSASNSNAPKPPAAGTAKTSITVRIGAGFAGAGGAGGTGGAVSVTNSGQLQTNGPDSTALMAESVGGGGGAGGASNPASNLLISNPSAADLVLGVGGSGGSSGNSGTVTIANSGYILTSGDASDGILAQSIGGGGGDGGATLAQNGVLSKASFSIGGSGGSSGSGGSVSVSVGQNDSADIDTLGRDSVGVLAQSIGGGGGDALLLGTSPTGEGGNGRSGTGLSNGTLLPPSTLLSIAIDGPGGAAGHGGPVTVLLNSSQGNGLGLIYTGGTDSYGVLAQSVGGGGGLLTGVATRNNTLSTLFAGPRTGNGDGGRVNVTLERNYSIYTDGAGAAGIVAQSVGGGGGLIGGLDKVDLTQPIRTTPSLQNGQGGNVSVTLDNGGNIVTNGARAHGILAESLGGGGGILDQPDGTGFAFSSASRYTGCSGAACTGAVSVTLGGGTVVRVFGAGAYGIVVQSRGNGVNDTTVNVGSGGAVESWGQSAGAIFVDGAGTNRIINAGLIDNGMLVGAPTPSGVAIAGNTPVTISNTGTINGSIILPVRSAIANEPGGLLETGTTVTLGPGDALSNDGVLSPGGAQRIAATTLTGNLVQNGDGTVAIDIAPATGQTDHLQVLGQATLAGSLAVVADGPVSLVPHSTNSDIITATDGLTDNTLHVVSGTPVVDYTVSNPDPDDLVLDTTVDFTAAQALGAAGLLSRDRESLGTAFDTIELQGPGALAPVAEAIAAIPTAPALAQTYDSLSGQSVVDAQQVSFSVQQQFEARILQQVSGEAGVGVPASATPHHLGPEAWIVGFGNNDLLKGTSGEASLASQTAGGAFGLADWFSDTLMAGVSVGGGGSSFSVSDETNNGTDRSVNVGLYGLARRGSFYASGILSYGNYGVNETRIGIGQLIGLNDEATSNFGQNAFGGRVEVGRVWSVGRMDVTPFAALETDGLWQGHFAESDTAGSAEAAAVALRYDSHSSVSVPSTIGVRADWRVDMGGGQVLVPTLQLGWVHEFRSTRTLDAAFAGAPGVSFETEGVEASRNAVQTIAGAALSLTRSVSLIATFDGTFSNVETAVGGYAGLSVVW